ncbi:MAG: hypothetical protein GW836_12110 [Paraglaciecola sp.]|nr:hypothetical protein [Paraglaciecola sp.]
MTIPESQQHRQKILLIKMLSAADVGAIGVPALRFFKQQFGQAELQVLTFGGGAELLQLAEPQVRLHILEHWPDDFFLAMETFLGLAEQIIGEGYQQIINLDTAFMPCFLARFLKDAGEPISGNYLSISIQALLDKVQDKSLQADYVNVSANYLQSSFFGMSRWHSRWWESQYLPDGGYPEFYLRQCCGFSDLRMDSYINLKQAPFNPKAPTLIGICTEVGEDGYAYPHSVALKAALQRSGFKVWLESEIKGSYQSLLSKMQQSHIVVCKAGGSRWLANHVGSPVLLISGAAEPNRYMPDFATDQRTPCERHSPLFRDRPTKLQPCNCENPQLLADNIASLLTMLALEEGSSDA